MISVSIIYAHIYEMAKFFFISHFLLLLLKWVGRLPVKQTWFVTNNVSRRNAYYEIQLTIAEKHGATIIYNIVGIFDQKT